MINNIISRNFDDRRRILIGNSTEDTLQKATEHWIQTACDAILARARFAVALSGGTTPNAIYHKLSTPAFAHRVDWSKVWLFWSDERAIAPDHAESNYRMAMQSGLAYLPIPSNQIIRMKAESDIEKNASDYETLITNYLDSSLFDLVMLGMGEDGHTASLFPNTHALKMHNRLCVANHVPSKNTWRMTLTFSCINRSRLAVIYVLGASKQKIVKSVLESPLPSQWPASYIGTVERQALWILDREASKLLP